VYMDTGAGKTYIAIMLIKRVFDESAKFNLRQLSKGEIDKKLFQREQVPIE